MAIDLVLMVAVETLIFLVFFLKTVVVRRCGESA